MCNLKHLHILKVSPRRPSTIIKGRLPQSGNPDRYHLKQVIKFEIITEEPNPHHIPCDAMKDTPLPLRYSYPRFSHKEILGKPKSYKITGQSSLKHVKVIRGGEIQKLFQIKRLGYQGNEVQCMILNFILKVKVLDTQSCLTLCDPMDCNQPGSSVHGIHQAKIVEWVAILFSRGN